MYKKFLAFTMIIAMAFGFEAQAMQGQQAMAQNTRMLWAIGSALAMGAVAKAVRSPLGTRLTSQANYTTDEVDFLTGVTGVLSFMRIVDDSPMTRRWTAGLWATTALYKLWSSYWMQDLLKSGAGALGESIFPQKDIEHTKQQYEMFKQYSADLKIELKQMDTWTKEERDQTNAIIKNKQDFVDEYSRRKRNNLAIAVVTMATVVPLLPILYDKLQQYCFVNMGV